MISVQNRLPEPGKENRVSITPDSGSALEGVLAYADDATQEGTFWNRKTAQLLQGDIRTYPVRDGQSISAGDVVNVGGSPDTIYKDVVPQDNVENVIYSSSVAGTKICNVGGRPLCLFDPNANTTTSVYLLNPSTGKLVASAQVATSNTSNFDLDALDENTAIVTYSDSGVKGVIVTVSGSAVSVGYNNSLFEGPIDNSPAVYSLGADLAAVIYSSSGLKIRILSINRNTITTSGTVYSLPNNTGANYISACRLPDDSSGNKRVCICFSDTGDGNKGKAVIATINSANQVTWGDVVTFESGSVTAIKCAASEDTVCVAYIVQGQTYVTYITAIGSTITISGKKEKVNSGTSYYCDIARIGSKFICAYSETQGFARTVNAGTEITMGAPFMLNDNLTNYPSIAVIDDNHLILAYADSGNSNYGTTTILEVLGNQIAGSFIDESSDAIALADGTGGQSIPVGFGGYCECPGVTEGDTIDSAGVIAQAVQDGWLQIKSAWDKGHVVGTYMGDGTSNRLINIGFTPIAVIVANRGDFGASDKGLDYSAAFGITGNPGRATTYNNNPILVEITDNGFIVNTGFYNASSGTNMNNNPYYYIAWR